MKILVTGGAGFIGSNLVRHLIQQTNHEILNVDKLTYACCPRSLSDVDTSDRYHFEQIDLCDSERVHAAVMKFAPSAIMHLAAESHVDRSIDSPDAFIQTNIVGTYNLLHAARQYFQSLPNDQQRSFRFLHVSTDEVYGSLGSDDDAFCETTPYDPHSPYSASKASSDHLARAWHDTYNLPTLVTNCSNNYGPYQFPEKLIPVVILKCLRGEPIPVYGKGENIRDWLYVEDHCRALLRVLNAGRIGETYNIGGDNEQQNIDIVRSICGLLDELRPKADGSSYADQITFVTDRPGHDLRYAINAAKIKTELRWEPQETFQSGFRKTVQWYLANESWWTDILSGGYRLDRQGVTTP